jgi:DNA-binding transcriptional LysR family regulator
MDRDERISLHDASPALLYYLRTFRAVALARSFTEGGRALHLSQPAVSAQIRALERHFGGRLFEVRHRRVHLTAEGEALLPYAERVFSLLREADEAVAGTRGLERGRLVVAASTTIGNYLLPPVVRRFGARYPGIRVEVGIGNTAEVADRVAAEQVPLGMVEAPIDRDDVAARPFGEDELVLIATPAEPCARRGQIELDELRRLPLILREPGSRTRWLIERAVEGLGLELHGSTVLGSTEAIKEAVLAGMGLAWVPRATVAREIAAGDLRMVAVSDLAIRRTLWLLTPPDREPTGAAAAFVKEIDNLG